LETEDEHVRVLVVVGDISGFGAWFTSVSDVNAELKPFFKQYDALVDKLRVQGSFFKDLGDGFLFIDELKSPHACKNTIATIKSIWSLKRSIRKLIDGTPYPKPQGFRIRITCGHAWKKRHDKRIDYLGKHINLAFKLLRVHRSYPIVVHESAVALMSEKQMKSHGFDMKKLSLPSDEFEDIYRFEMSHLWGFGIKNGNRRKRLG
jgi:class 3 adenylate cyclase